MNLFEQAVLDAPGVDLRPLTVTGARARHTDPDTSREAARKHNHSGKSRVNRSLVLEAVSQRPGYTAAEYGVITELGHHEAQRRLSDLHKDAAVRKGQKRGCQVKGSQMLTWWPRS